MSKTISKKNKLIQFLGISMVALLLGSYVSISAIDNPYQAGETLDPNCVPGEVNCTVEIGSGSSEWTTSGEDIYFTGGNVGIGTNNPITKLDIKLDSDFSYSQSFSGIGLDDAIYSGIYTGLSTPTFFYLSIDSVGATDTFSYALGMSAECESYNIPITGLPQDLCNGISIIFNSINGHELYDSWRYDIESSPSSTAVFNIYDSNGRYFNVNAVVPDSIFIGTDTGVGAIGSYNSNFFGPEAGYQSTNSYNSNFFGPSAGYQSIGAGYSNFIGDSAGRFVTNTSDSNFIGRQSGDGATNSSNSNFIGQGSGQNANGSISSNFIGRYSGGATNASYSNFIGDSAGFNAFNASYSNFIGYVTGGRSAQEAHNSNFMGTGAGYSATNAAYSNFIGYRAGGGLYNVSNDGAYNASNSIFVGQYAGYRDRVDNTLDLDDWSILIGYRTNTGGFKNSILLGGSTSSTPISNTKANQFMLAPSITEMRLRGIDYTLPSSQGGASTILTNNGSGVLSWATPAGGLSSDADYNTKGGTSAGLNLVTGAQYNTFLGYEAGRGGVVTNSMDNNVAVGYRSFYSNTTGYSNTANGTFSLFLNTTGNGNTANGNSSLLGNTTGNYNTAKGIASLENNTTGNNNTATGAFSLISNTTGNNNTANGYDALHSSGQTVTAGSFVVGILYTIKTTGTTDFTLIGAGDSNPGTIFTATGIGSGTGTASSITNNNTAFGAESLYGIITGGNNTALGYRAGRYINGGSANTTSFDSLYLGSFTKSLTNNDQNEIVIGYNTTGNGSNTTTIGTGNVLYVGGGSISGVTARFTNSAGYCDINPTTATLACTSDVNLKKNIVDLNNEDFILNENIETPETILKKILTLTPVMYNWNTEENNKEKHIGLIAQEVEQLFPDIVSTDSKTSIKSIAYSNLIPYTIKAIQELDLKVEEIKVISPVSLGEMLSQFGDSVLLNIENGIAYLKDIAVETLRVGSPERRTGITLYDEETGDPYCLSISNGEQKIVSGECSIFEEEEATEEDLPVVEDESDSDIEDETQEEISIEGDIEATSEEEQSEKSTENQTEEQVLVTEEESSINPMVEEEFDTAIFE